MRDVPVSRFGEHERSGRVVGPWATGRHVRLSASLSWTLERHCVTRVRPVGCGALFWRAFRGNVALRLVGGECDLHIVRLGPGVVCRVVVASLCGLFMLSRRTSIMLRVRTYCELIWLASMETLLNDVPRKTVRYC